MVHLNETLASMTDLTLYHNPRCSKSRAALALLEFNGAHPTVVHYLDTPPDQATLTTVIRKLGIPARALLRTGEEEYRTLGLDNDSLSDQELVAAMVSNPKLIERPILTDSHRAIIGRPPERVLELLP